MIRVRSKVVLLVAPHVVGLDVLPNNKVFKHISLSAAIFPAIHDIKPNLLILDYDYLVQDIEKILRRLSSNPAYKSIKICCYKNKWHSKIDPFLKTLGVDHIFYAEDMKAEATRKSVFDAIGNVIMDGTFFNLLKPVH